MVRPVTQGKDNQILRAKSKETKRIDRSLKVFLRDLRDTLFQQNGLGIAAPQIGKNIRVFLALLNYGTNHETVVTVINPKILSKSQEEEKGEEGCLSVPGVFGIVPRLKELTVQFTNEKGVSQTLKLQDLNARIFQHEIDHLDGILCIDKMERLLTEEEKKERTSHKQKNEI